MTLNDFIANKPAELRLGQHFVNSYWKGSDMVSQRLYQMDGSRAVDYIQKLMAEWQWEELPKPAHKYSA